MLKKILIAATVIGLFGTMTNYVFMSPLPTLLAALLLPFAFANKKFFPKIVFWLLLFTGFAIISTLLYYPQSLISYQFYRYDGNFFISYLPLLVLPFLSFNFDIGKLLKTFLVVTTGVYVLVFIYDIVRQVPGFTGLFTSTNGAGGFFSIVTSLAFLFFLQRKTYANFFLLILNITFLISTYSRGSILGLVLGIMALFFIETKRKHLLYCMFIGLSAIQIFLLAYAYSDYKKYIMTGPKANIYENYNDFAGREFGLRSTKLNNVYNRMYETWPRGLNSFLESPLVGTGFGSVNDVPFQFKQVVPLLVTTNEQENKVFNDSHAHHSFLHFLGEIGIIGTGLFLIFWFSVYNFLIKNKHHSVTRSFLIVSFFNLTIMSFTEHRLTTPSNALPFVIVLGLYHVYVNYQKKIAILSSTESKVTSKTPSIV